jgi:SAM-dependent methyltransferase
MISLKSLVNRIVRSDLGRKEDWEFEWQRDEWVRLYSEPKIKAKVFEYWVKYRHLQDILNLVGLDETSRLLDVGCGISSVLHYLPGRRYGIDPLADRYKTIYDYPKDIDVRRAYGESIPFESDAFDIVFCSNCIDHTSDAKQTITEIKRVLKPTGYFVLTCEVFEKDLGKRNDAHPYSMTLEKLTKLVSDFPVVAHWDSPWIGLRNYVKGEPASDQLEHIFLLRKS